MSTAAQPAASPAPIQPDLRRQLMDTAVNEWTANGWSVASRSDFQAVFAKGHRPNHILHLLLTIITAGLWGLFVWLPLSIFGGEKRKTVSVDEYGKRVGR